MERRGFLDDLNASAAALASGAIPYGVSHLLAPGCASAQHNYLRPPGALDDDAAFVAARIGCGLCVEVCPHPSKPIWIVGWTEKTIVKRNS